MAHLVINNKTNVGYGIYSERLHCGVINNVMMECMVNTMGNVSPCECYTMTMK